MNEQELGVLQRADKREVVSYLFERTLIDMALECREILNKVVTKDYAEADTGKLVTIANALHQYTRMAEGEINPVMPAWLGEAFAMFASRFTKQSEPKVGVNND